MVLVYTFPATMGLVAAWRRSRVRKNMTLRLMSFLMIMVLTCAAQSSDRSKGMITGVVTDPGGASLSKARVLLVDLRSLQNETVVTGADGRFAFHSLQPGDYALIVAGSTDPSEACWRPAMREVKIETDVSTSLQVPLLLDNQRCPGGAN
jgi:hypothetical protein